MIKPRAFIAISALLASIFTAHSYATDDSMRLIDHLSEINQEAGNTLPNQATSKPLQKQQTRSAPQRSKEEILRRIKLTNQNSG